MTGLINRRPDGTLPVRNDANKGVGHLDDATPCGLTLVAGVSNGSGKLPRGPRGSIPGTTGCLLVDDTASASGVGAEAYNNPPVLVRAGNTPADGTLKAFANCARGGEGLARFANCARGGEE